MRSVKAHAELREERDGGLHELRIAAKKLRFTVEPLVAIASLTSRERSAAAKIVDEAVRLQDVLGDHHDAILLATLIENVPGAERKMIKVSALMATKAAVNTSRIVEDALALVSRSEQLADALVLGDRLEEVERRWLLREIPPLLQTGTLVNVCFISQGFVAAPIYERLREARCCLQEGGESCTTARTRTFKAGDHWAHFEYEESVSDALWAALWPLTEGRRIQKRRVTVPADEHIGEWEIDVFSGVHAGLVIAEFEFAHRNETLPIMPGWLRESIVREVTGERNFSNFDMAIRTID